MPRSEDNRSPVILWFRKDLRLGDNRALDTACRSGAPIICVYIRETNAAWGGANGAAQAWWLHHSLKALDKSLRTRGNRLLLLSGEPGHLLEWLMAETGANTVYWNRRYDPNGIETDSELKSRLRGEGNAAESFPGFLMHEPSKLLTRDGRKYAVYTPFWRSFEASCQPHDPLPAPSSIPALTLPLTSENLDDWNLLPTKPDWAAGFEQKWKPGEDGAHQQLSDFVKSHLDDYKTARDFPAKHTTSRLSPHLALGEISPNQIWHATLGLPADVPEEDVIHFRKEVVWREFSWHLLFHNPHLPTTNLNRRFDDFPWLEDGANLRAWQRGLTGYPLVDAGMRELWQTGWMHNRVRMVVASFLIKDLLIDWREGEKWFRDTLLDADVANNAASWQWVAGCGADAAPYFRIFNPSRQGETFDPDGTYVKQYCPELSDLPDRYIHRPFEAPEAVLEAAGIALGKTYPKPIVEHDQARKRALAAYKELSGHVEP